MKRFQDQRVMVTGAGSGIGFGICRKFALEGAIVGLNDVNEPLAFKAVNKILSETKEEKVKAYPFDVSDVTEAKEQIMKFSKDQGGLNVMVVNAGITNYGPFLDYPPEAFERLLAVNIKGSFFTAQAAAKEMIAHKLPGRIIFMSSVTGVQAHLNLSAYGATKAALIMLAKNLALELGPYNITVNAIGAGATITERTIFDDPHYEENWNEVAPNKRTATVEDIANSVLFLASPEARHITGETLMVDGGWTIHSPLPKNHPQV